MPLLAPNTFFQEKRSFEETKQEILQQYFETWCNIRLNRTTAEEGKELLFVDLHAAAAVTEERTKPASLQLLERLYRSTGKTPDLNKSVVVFLKDPVRPALEEISQQVEQLPFYADLAQEPLLLNQAAQQEVLQEALAHTSGALLFLNPFRYSYAQDVLLKALPQDNADLLLQFCPYTLVKALSTKKVSKQLVELFGDRLIQIAAFCRKEKTPARRQVYLMQQVLEVLQEKNYHVQQLQINLPDEAEVVHYLLLCTRNAQVYRSFKETLLPYSDYQKDEVPLFICNQGTEQQLALFPQQQRYKLEYLVADLEEQASLFRYKSIEKIYEEHSIGTPYTLANYMDACSQLQEQRKVEFLNPKTMQTIRKPIPASKVKFKV